MEEKIMSCAKGSWQRSLCRNLVNHGRIYQPIANLQGAAKSYSRKYSWSLNSLLDRLEKAGIKLKMELGPRGGYFSRSYYLEVE